MGVDYRANSGYGFVIPEEELEELAEDMDYPDVGDDFEPHSFGWWLVDKYAGLDYQYVGDFMGGGDMYLVIEAKSSAQVIDFHYFNNGGIRKFNYEGATLEEKRDLLSVYRWVFGIDPQPGEISWYMSATIS